jgi:hypothetical protein
MSHYYRFRAAWVYPSQAFKTARFILAQGFRDFITFYGVRNV